MHIEPCQSLSKYQKWGREEGGGMVWECYVMIKAKQKHWDQKNMFFLHTTF